jgi:LuxR family maltose regulon positive regulatory protein
MPETLLRTKLNIPPLRPNLVSRPRLIERLNQGLQLGHKLTLVSAPAGFGKTTLVANWLNQLAIDKTAWLSLDETDNDPTRFLTYFIAALQTIESDLGEGALTALQSPQPPAMEVVLTTLINQINAIPDTSVLILDDYHLIAAQPVHDVLTFLLEHLSGNMHLVVATRSDPPLLLARFRGRGQLTELRETDLRFTRDEAGQFIKVVMGLDLSADDLSALTARTEGWIAGLQMAAVSMQSREHSDDVTSFIQAFTGSNRFILDYLVEEVLESQPDSIQTFLLHTAVLERLTAPLCDAVLGSADVKAQERREQTFATSQDTLEQLERANLFIVPLDDERRWYRYHHLFADLLRNQLNRNHPGLRLTLHRRASQWFEQEGLIPEAMGHAIATEDFDRAATLLEPLVSPLLNESRPAALLSLMARLPDETIAARPWLCVHAAWAYFLTWQFDPIEPLLQAAEARLPDNVEAQPSQTFANNTRIRSRIVTLRAFWAQWQGELARATALSHEALKGLDEDDLQLRSVLETNLGDICVIRGDLVSARQHLKKSVTAGKAAGNFYAAVCAVSRLAELEAIQGRLHQAVKTYLQAIRLGVEWGGGKPMPGTGRAHVGLAQVLYEWNELDEAARHLRRGIRLGKQCGEQEVVLAGVLTLARLRQAQGKADATTEALERAEAIARRDSGILYANLVSSWQARTSLAQGDLTAARRWADSQESTLDVSDIPDFRLEEPGLTLVRVRIAQASPRGTARGGRVEEATRLLEQLLLAAEAGGRVARVIEIQMLRALALQAGSDVDQAMIPLEQALSLAEPQAYVRIFLDEGSPMARLLYEAAARKIAPQYTGKLLASFGGEDSLQPSTSDPEPLIEPLSNRELQVLQLIAEGLSNQEIASKLVLSLNTVKGHTRKIYGKLGVNSRTQAVAKAEALGIHLLN